MNHHFVTKRIIQPDYERGKKTFFFSFCLTSLTNLIIDTGLHFESSEKMASNVDFEYEDEESIDGNLKCSICSDPLTDPMITLCHHSFCRLCLTKWLNNDKSTCPTYAVKPYRKLV